MADFMTKDQRLAQQRYIALALSGRTEKVPRMVRRKREKLASTLAWS